MKTDNSMHAFNINSNRFQNIISERTGIHPDVVRVILEEYELSAKELLIIKRKPLNVFGIGVISLYDVGENYLDKSGKPCPALRLSFRSSLKTKKILHQLCGFDHFTKLCKSKGIKLRGINGDSNISTHSGKLTQSDIQLL